MNTIPTIKSSLIAGMDERRARAENLIRQVSPDLQVHENSDWTAKDLILHLTAVEDDMIDAIQTFLNGEKYRLDLRGQTTIDGFNELRRHELAHTSWEQALQEWQDVRDQLRGIVIAFPESKLDIPFSTPFLTKYNFLQAVKACGLHEKQHLNEIKLADRAETDA